MAIETYLFRLNRYIKTPIHTNTTVTGRVIAKNNPTSNLASGIGGNEVQFKVMHNPGMMTGC